MRRRRFGGTSRTRRATQSRRWVPALEVLDPRRVLAFVWDGNPWNLPDNDVFQRSFDLGFGSGEVIQQIEVWVSITHPRLSDLSVSLVGPNATRVPLALAGELTGDMIRARFNDAAVAEIAEGMSPYDGRFAPAGSLGAFEGRQFNGTWTIEVADTVAGSSGTLNSWAIYVNEPPPELAFQRARLVDSSGTEVPTFLPGDEIGVHALWQYSELHTFGNGIPYTVRIAVDGVAMEDELLGTVGTLVTGTELRGWEATQGVHTVEITLDPENRIWELDETNNVYSFQFEVQDLPRAARLVDLTTDNLIDYPHSLVQAGGNFYFLMSQQEQPFVGRQIWRTDGTQAGTEMIYQSPFINPEAVGNLTVVGQRLFFTDNTFGRGEELWTSDGTAAGTRLVDPLSFDSQPRDLTPYQGALHFTRRNPDRPGRSLWKTDGTPAGTVLVSDAVTNAGRLTPVGNTLYFAGTDSLHGTELWKTDGTTAGTRLVADIRPGPESSLPDQMVWVGDELFFTARTAEHGRELWASDGSTARLVADTRPGTADIGSFLDAVDFGGVAFFQGSYAAGTYDPELWRSDGTASGTGLFLDIHPTHNSRPDELTVVGDTLFFSAADAVHGRELWASDGTVESTRMVVDLRAGDDSAAPQQFVEMRGNLVFLAHRGSWHFHASDGYSDGTGLVAMLPPLRGKYVDASDSEVLALGDQLYFFWSDAETGRNLWSVTLGEFPSTLPDLYTAGASLFEAPPQFAWGDHLQLNLAVANDGARTSLSPATVAAVYLSADPQITLDDFLLEGTAAGRLAVPPVGSSYARLQARNDELRLPSVPPAELPATGVFYIGIVIDPEDGILELNEANNSNQGLLVDVFPIRIGAPDLVHVITHGFRFPGASVSEFLEPWQNEYPDVLRELARGTALERQMEILSPAWDSTTGFLWAFADQIIHELIAGDGDLPESGPLATLARWLNVGEEHLAYRHAADAAHEILATIRHTPHLQARQFHLIGHSRGAAVNALLSKLLTADGFEVVQYTALDGYSKDWPVPSGVLGDISIVEETTALRKVNYRVELGLNGLPAEFVRQVVLDRLGIGTDFEHLQESLDDLEDTIRAFADRHWKAPDRQRFGFEDKFIFGQGLDLSDHLDVHRLYFHSAGNPSNTQYVLDSPLGAAVGQAGQGSFQNRSFSGQGSPGRSLHGLTDGSFEQAGAAWQQAVAIADGQTVDDPLLSAWLDTLRDARVILHSRWVVGGSVALKNVAGNWWLEMTEGPEAGLAQPVQLPPDVMELTFDLEVLQPRAGATLEVTFADQVLRSLDLSAALPPARNAVPLETLGGRTGSLGIRLRGAAAEPAVVRIDNLDVHTPLAIDTLVADPWSVAPGEQLTLGVPAGEVDAASVTEVAFFLESNGVPGLQFGTSGDRPVAVDLAGHDGWSVLIDADSLLPGSHAAYAVARDASGTIGLPGVAMFSVLFGDTGWRNPVDRLDVNADGLVSPVDVLTIVNNINSQGARSLPRPSYLTVAPPGFIDPTGDGSVSAGDALAVINALNSRSGAAGESTTDHAHPRLSHAPDWRLPIPHGSPLDDKSSFTLSGKRGPDCVACRSNRAIVPRQVPELRQGGPLAAAGGFHSDERPVGQWGADRDEPPDLLAVRDRALLSLLDDPFDAGAQPTSWR